VRSNSHRPPVTSDGCTRAVPPHYDDVASAIEDLIAFVRRDDIPVLAHAAIVHAQFETIHPFTDGNGRTGRSLLHAMLRNKRLIRNVTVPVSAGLLVDLHAYFDALGDYRRGDPTRMVTALTDASFAAVANARHLIGACDSGRVGRTDQRPTRLPSRTADQRSKVSSPALRPLGQSMSMT